MDSTFDSPLPLSQNEENNPALPSLRPMTLGETLFSFNGRIGCRRWWLTQVGAGICFLITEMFQSISEVEQIDTQLIAILTPLVILFFAFTLCTWVVFASNVKRWHDLGKSGWWELIRLIPLIGALWGLIVLGFSVGNKGENEYGITADSLPA